MYYKDRINLVTLNTLKVLNVLKILTDLNAEIADPVPSPIMANSTNDKEAITASKTFYFDI